MTEVPVTWIFLRELAALVEGGRGDVACEGKVMQVLNDTSIQKLQARDIRSCMDLAFISTFKLANLFCTATKKKRSADDFLFVCLFVCFCLVVRIATLAACFFLKLSNSRFCFKPLVITTQKLN